VIDLPIKHNLIKAEKTEMCKSMYYKLYVRWALGFFWKSFVFIMITTE